MARNIVAVVPCMMAFAYPTKEVYLTCFVTQAFRDIPDTVSGMVREGMTAMYISFAGLVIADLVAIFAIVGS